MFSQLSVDTIRVVAFLQMCHEDNTARRKDQFGLKPRTRRGFAKALLNHYSHGAGFRAAANDTALRDRLFVYFHDCHNPIV